MKKNLVPLVGIAFVVALVSTGLFYGLFARKLKDSSSAAPTQTVVVAARNVNRGTELKAEDIRTVPWGGAQPLNGGFSNPAQVVGMFAVQNLGENEPLMAAHVASLERGAGAGMGIPVGMRAVSVHVSDSAGVIAMLRPGYRVDVQAVGGRPEPELRTLLQNVEVLSVSPHPDGSGGRNPLPVVNLIVTPAEADLVGLADSAARVRVALRNPLDGARAPSPNLAMAALFRNPLPAREPAARAVAATPAPATAAVTGQVSLWVRFAGLAAGGSEDLRPWLARASRTEGFEIAALRRESDVEGMVSKMEAARHIEILGASRVQAGPNREASVDTSTRGDGTIGLRIGFEPLPSRPGALRLKVRPSATLPGKNGPATRRVETEVDLADGQSFILSGLVEKERSVIERLFPGRVKQAQELVVLVTPRRIQPVASAALIR